MKFHKNLLIATAFFAATQAYAACTPATGTTGDDTLTCTGAVSGVVDLLAGNDTINASGATFSDNINFDDWGDTGNDSLTSDNSIFQDVYFQGGVDTITDNGSTFGYVQMGDGDDVLNLTNSTFDYVQMGDGNDVLDLTNSTFESLYLGNGDDNVNADGLTVTTIYWTDLGDGDDVFIVKNGNFTGAVRDGTGNDIITLTDTTVGTFIHGDFIGWGSNVGGNDVITLDNTSVGTGIWGERIHADDSVGGNDTITLKNGSSVGEYIYGDVLRTKVNQTGGDDIITLEGGSSVGNGILGDFIVGRESTGGDDTIILTDSSAGGWVLGDSINSMNAVRVWDEDTQTYLNQQFYGSSYGGDDTITLTRSSAGFVTGERIIGNNSVAGTDTITLVDSEVTHDVVGDFFPDDTDEDATTSEDTFVVNNDNDISDGNIGAADIIKITGSTIGGRVTGAYFIGNENTAGADEITLNNSTANEVVGSWSKGDDNIAAANTIIVAGGSEVAGVISGESMFGNNNTGSADTITLDASKAGTIIGDWLEGDNNTGADDVINIVNGSTVGDVYADSTVELAAYGSDTVNLDNSIATGTLDGGDDVSTADGWVDTLNISNYIGSAVDYLNFEDMNIINSTIDFGDSYVSPESINLTVDEASTLTMTGETVINSNVENNGLFDMLNGTVGDHLTIKSHDTAAGDLTGSGVYAFDTDFASLTSDYVTVEGNVATNDAVIAITDITGSESSKAGEILLIEAPNDTQKADESFILAKVNQYDGDTNRGRFTNSIYVWDLKTSGNNWILKSAEEINDNPPVVPEIPGYASLPTIGREIGLSEIQTIHRRIGEIRDDIGWTGYGPSNLRTNLGKEWTNVTRLNENKWSGWIRGTIAGMDLDASSQNYDLSGTYGGFDLGIDRKNVINDEWAVFTGLFGGYRTGSFTTDGTGTAYQSIDAADMDFSSWSIGAYASFFYYNSTFIDLVLKYTDMNADIDSAGLKSSTDGYSLGGSIEVGHGADIADNWILEPQAQLTALYVSWDDFNDGINDVSIDNHTYLIGRLGVRVEGTFEIDEDTEFKPWAVLSVIHDFSDAPDVTYADETFLAYDAGTVGEIKLGATYKINETVMIYGDVAYATNFDNYNHYRGDIGVRVSW
ncbi:MAG: autotransporter outer membrane beta-barrel domain-containing protein [Alphaproteobacteria bacterium]